VRAENYGVVAPAKYAEEKEVSSELPSHILLTALNAGKLNINQPSGESSPGYHRIGEILPSISLRPRVATENGLDCLIRTSITRESRVFLIVHASSVEAVGHVV
jgi:hypothetical protein